MILIIKRKKGLRNNIHNIMIPYINYIIIILISLILYYHNLEEFINLKREDNILLHKCFNKNNINNFIKYYNKTKIKNSIVFFNS